MTERIWSLSSVEEGETCALAFLLGRGWREIGNGLLFEPYGAGEPWPDEDMDAFDYLFREWDFALAPREKGLQ